MLVVVVGVATVAVLLRFATYFAVTGKSGPQSLDETPAQAVLEAHFGELTSGISAT